MEDEDFTMKTNFHTHTARCCHASGRDEEYVQSAIRGGYQILGFADHSPWQFSSSYRSHMRMNPREQFQDYLQSIRTLRRKYRDQIDIRIGLECEYFPPYMDWLRQLIRKERLDYIILGNHFEYSEETGFYFGRRVVDEATLERYVNSALEGMPPGCTLIWPTRICLCADILPLTGTVKKPASVCAAPQNRWALRWSITCAAPWRTAEQARSIIRTTCFGRLPQQKAVM